MSQTEPTRESIVSALEMACRCQHIAKITAGRQRVLAFPRAWVLDQLEQVASESLNLSDEWEYRRLLELAELLDYELLQRVIRLGLDSVVPEVREAALDFKSK